MSKKTMWKYRRCAIPGFGRSTNQTLALSEFYAAYDGSFFTDASGQIIGPIVKG